jgi:hypothetical protein
MMSLANMNFISKRAAYCGSFVLFQFFSDTPALGDFLDALLVRQAGGSFIKVDPRIPNLRKNNLLGVFLEK